MKILILYCIYSLIFLADHVIKTFAALNSLNSLKSLYPAIVPIQYISLFCVFSVLGRGSLLAEASCPPLDYSDKQICPPFTTCIAPLEEHPERALWLS